MWMIGTEERRQWRSNHREEALHFQLLHAAVRFDFDAFILADPEGELVATSTSSEDGDTIARVVAAFAPLLTDERSGAERAAHATRWLEEELDALGLTWGRPDLQVREFYAGEHRLVLIGVGGNGGPQEELGLHRVVFGVRRIWAETGRG